MEFQSDRIVPIGHVAAKAAGIKLFGGNVTGLRRVWFRRGASFVAAASRGPGTERGWAHSGVWPRTTTTFIVPRLSQRSRFRRGNGKLGPDPWPVAQTGREIAVPVRAQPFTPATSLTTGGGAAIPAAMALYPLLRPFAFALDAERAHRWTIAALK